MRPKRYGGLKCLRNSVNSRHLFTSFEKSLALYEILEFSNCRCIGKYWVVKHFGLNEAGVLEWKKVLETPVYSVAWDLVKDPAHELKRGKRW